MGAWWICEARVGKIGISQGRVSDLEFLGFYR